MSSNPPPRPPSHTNTNKLDRKHITDVYKGHTEGHESLKLKASSSSRASVVWPAAQIHQTGKGRE